VRKTLLSLAVLLGCCGVAHAEENDWSGFYLGANVGRTAGDAESRAVLSGLWTGDVAASPVAQGLSAGYEPSGVSTGIQFGYDHQFPNRWVVGVEADYMQPGADESVVESATIDIGGGTQANLQATTSADIDRAYSIRSKLGYAAGNVLWSLTAGYARTSADVRSAYTFTVPSLSSSFSKAGGESLTSSGFVWGAGVDWRFAPHWNAGLRYTRSKGDSVTYSPITTSRTGLYTLVVTDNAVERISHSVEHDNLSLSINYRF